MTSTTLTLVPTAEELTRQILGAISDLNRWDTVARPTAELFEKLLNTLLSVTQSEHGFIGVVLSDADGQHYLSTRAVTELAWDGWKEAFEKNAPAELQVRDLDTLFGQVIRTGQPLFTNRAGVEPGADGARRGQRPLRSFMGVPLRAGDRIVGMAGLANRPAGYGAELLNAIDPLVGTVARVLDSHREQVQHGTLDEAQRLREQRASLVVDSSGDGVFDWDLVSGDLYLSPQWKAMLGYRDDELASSVVAWRDRIHPEDIASATVAFESHLAGTSQRLDCEYRLQHRDGSWLWAKCRGRIVAWARDGSPRRFVGAQTDITDIRRAEEALVSAKVAGLAAARAQAEFLAVVSHELRTPLNAINGMATLLADTHLDDLQRDYVGTLEGSSDALLVTLNDILGLAALDSGQVRLESRAYDPRAVAREVLYDMRGSALEKGLALQYEGSSEPLWVLGDSRAVRQILTYLVGNAIKFTDKGSVSVAASIQAGRVCFRVEDTGIGIPEEQLDRVFEPFAQVHPSFTRSRGDSGLGLAICKRWVDLMEGEIHLESIETQGTSFEVHLPAPPTQSPLRLASSPDPVEGVDAELRERQPCVLVAEDNPVNQKVARAFLEKLGVRVDCVGNGLEAVRAASRFPYDLVLMDCQMPVMDGYTATERLRALTGSVREVPVVALTADALDSARERCFAVGMDGFLTKPLQLPDLRRALYETLLVGRRGGDPVAFSQRGRVLNPTFRESSIPVR